MSSWNRRSASSLIRISFLTVVLAHFVDELGKLGELGIVDAHRGHRTRFAFDGAPGFEQLEEADVLVTGCA